jgi:hypothetical protein
MRSGPAQIQSFQRRLVLCPSCHRPHEEQLIEADVAVKNIPLGDSEAALQVQRRNIWGQSEN